VDRSVCEYVSDTDIVDIYEQGKAARRDIPSILVSLARASGRTDNPEDVAGNSSLCTSEDLACKRVRYFYNKIKGNLPSPTEACLAGESVDTVGDLHAKVREKYGEARPPIVLGGRGWCEEANRAIEADREWSDESWLT